MNFEEFLQPRGEVEQPIPSNTVVNEEEETPVQDDVNQEADSAPDITTDLEIQKSVVESLAADKAEQQNTIASLRKDNYSLQSQIAALNLKIAEQAAALAKVGEVLASNAADNGANKLALLDRDMEVPDRFEGETRDHVLEVLAEARSAAEKEGRLRRAQLLEAVLSANEPCGELARRRAELEKLFNDNANLVTGPVIAELEKREISHKHGEEYLLPREIIARVY